MNPGLSAQQNALGSTSTSKDEGFCLPTCRLQHLVLYLGYSPFSLGWPRWRELGASPSSVFSRMFRMSASSSVSSSGCWAT